MIESVFPASLRIPPEPGAHDMDPDFLERIVAHLHTPSFLVTPLGITGSIPTPKHARMIVGAEGLICGTVGGGSMEGFLIETCRQRLRQRSVFALLSKIFSIAALQAVHTRLSKSSC